MINRYHTTFLFVFMFFSAAVISTAQTAPASENISRRDPYVKKSAFEETLEAGRRRLAELIDTDRIVKMGPWYMSGPIVVEGFSQAGFAEKAVDLSSKDQDGKEVWTCRPDLRDGSVHLLHREGGTSTYLFRTISVGRALKRKVNIGSNDGIEIWLNGKKILSNEVKRTAKPDQKLVELDLAQGENRLLMKIYNRDSKCEFYFAVRCKAVLSLWENIERDFQIEADWLKREIPEETLHRWMLKADVRIGWDSYIQRIIDYSRKLAKELNAGNVDVQAIKGLERQLKSVETETDAMSLYIKGRRLQRKLTMVDPLLDFDGILFTKRVPGSFSHMSDQYYGWWSRPGGGIYILRNYKTDNPTVECLTDSFEHEGSFLRPMISYDAGKVLFSWCRYYPHLAQEKDKVNKDNIPQDAFYHVFEMNIDGTNVQQLTFGKYNDFDGRYLPDGRIVFLSTRRGQFIQCGQESAQQTLYVSDLPDSYVRCGGGAGRPVAVYTLHTMDPDGSGLCAVSPFENFEWTPSVAHDGTVLYSRWDYVDRHNQPYMSLWSMNPDGTNAKIVYGNFTEGPNCDFEPRSVPNSNKIVFTGSAHHAQTMGSLVLLDQAAGSEGEVPVKRLTPEVPFPEIEGWSSTYYANPWPLSERLYLVAWGIEKNTRQGLKRIPNGMGLYLLDAEGNMELLYRDMKITSAYPMPVRPRKRPPVLASHIDHAGPKEGCFIVTDVYRGLKTVKRGDIKKIRIVAVPPKTQPKMDTPKLGHTRDDPGKCVIGTVPVMEDGSAYFTVPSGVIYFFQVLDSKGMAVQTMRSVTHVQPGQTLSCIGCHESRHQAPNSKRVLATQQGPSKITAGPQGSWPLRFDVLVQPVLEKNCIACHNPKGSDKIAAKFDLTAEKAYDSMCSYGDPSLRDMVVTRYKEGYSLEGACAARSSQLLAKVTDAEGHHSVKLDAESLERLITWMDTYAQKAGSFSSQQEQRLLEIRRRYANLLVE